MLREVLAGAGLLIALILIATGFLLAWQPLGFIIGGVGFGWWVLAAVDVGEQDELDPGEVDDE